MIAWFISNKYFLSKNLSALKDCFFEAAKNHSINLTAYNNFEINKLIYSEKYEKPDFVIFWDKDIKLANYLENIDIKVFNSSESIRLCDDKALTYLKLFNTNIRQPKTLISPLLYNYDIDYDNDFIKYASSYFTFPFVFKECFGSFGEQVYLINNKDELIYAIQKVGVKPYILQEFIKSSFGKDLRVYVVGNNVIGTMKRTNNNGDFRANIGIGGIGSKYITNEKEKEIALKATKELGLTFAGVDLLFGENGDPILCEVNSNAYFIEFNKIFGLNVADYILEHILNIVG